MCHVNGIRSKPGMTKPGNNTSRFRNDYGWGLKLGIGIRIGIKLGSALRMQITLGLDFGLVWWRNLDVPGFVVFFLTENPREYSLYSPVLCWAAGKPAPAPVSAVDSVPRNYFKTISENKDVTRALMMLSWCVASVKTYVAKALSDLGQFSFLYLDDKEKFVEVRTFVQSAFLLVNFLFSGESFLAREP